MSDTTIVQERQNILRQIKKEKISLHNLLASASSKAELNVPMIRRTQKRIYDLKLKLYAYTNRN